MRIRGAVILATLGFGLASCAEPAVAARSTKPVWPRAPTPRLPDSALPVEHVRGSVYRTRQVVPATRGAYGWQVREDAGLSGMAIGAGEAAAGWQGPRPRNPVAGARPPGRPAARLPPACMLSQEI